MITAKTENLVGGTTLNEQESRVHRTEELRQQSMFLQLSAQRLHTECEDLRKHTIALQEASRIARGNELHVLKKCSCGKEYHVPEWFNLPFAGYQEGAGMSGEMRHCDCNSTLLFITRRESR